MSTTAPAELAALGRRVRSAAVVSDTVADFTISPQGDLVASLRWLSAHNDVELGRIYQLCC